MVVLESSSCTTPFARIGGAPQSKQEQELIKKLYSSVNIPQFGAGRSVVGVLIILGTVV